MKRKSDKSWLRVQSVGRDNDDTSCVWYEGRLSSRERSQHASEGLYLASEIPSVGYRQISLASSEWMPVRQSSGDETPTSFPSRYYGNIYDTQNCWGQAEM